MRQLSYYLNSCMTFKKLDSTSSFLKREYKSLKDLTFVEAYFQTDGHGRMGRKWESKPKENLMFSFLVKNEKLMERFDSISLAVSKAVYDVFKTYTDKVMIKWPNDVYIKDYKATGIILESVSDGSDMECLIVGVGINLNQAHFLNPRATSLYRETGKKIDHSKFRKKVYKAIKNELIKIENGDNSYLDVIRENNYLLNKETYAEINGEKKLVKVLGINDNNSLLIQVSGEEISIKSGEITFHIE